MSTEQIYESSLRTPGQPRPTSKSVFEQSIQEGVRAGLFGLGAIVDNRPVCFYFGQPASVALSENEVLISKDLCLIQQQEVVIGTAQQDLSELGGVQGSDVTSTEGAEPQQAGEDVFRQLRLRFKLPRGKLSDVLSVIRYLQSKFEGTRVELSLEKGAMSERDYQDKVVEAFRQMGIDVERD